MSHEIGETVYCNLSACLFTIEEEKILAGLLAAAVFRIAKASGKCCLYRRTQHYRCFVIVCFKALQKLACKTEVALHEFFRILRTVYACQVKYKVTVPAVIVEICRCGIYVIFVDLIYLNSGSCLVLTVFNVPEVIDKSGTDHALCARYEDLHESFLQTILFTTPT